MSGPDHRRAIERYRGHAAGYDASARRTMSYRLRTIARLHLQPGQTVVDVACGTGLSFAPLLEAVGEQGRVVGVEVSPDMMALARERVARQGWRNVDLVEASAEAARLPRPAHAMLFNYTHDILRSPAALANLFGQVGAGARVAVAGMKYAPAWLAPINLFVMLKARPYSTTLEGLARPWSLLEDYLERFEFEPTMLGTGYIGWGVARIGGRAQ
jgi:demethylmenaquinone methyltransferase/2-methoxy-6-polyprenyl-1,4-benzoquinol methylase